MKYEMMFIIKPLEQDKINYAINRVVGFVKEIGVLTDVKRWGKRNLAYEIKGVKVGYYVIITFLYKCTKDIINYVINFLISRIISS